MENLAQLPSPPKPLQDTAGGEESATRGSTDSTTVRPLPPPAQLAESALSNLRKTLVTQRPGSPGIKSSSSGPDLSARSRTTLEDRLRAKFVLGEASGGTTPSQSQKTSPASTPVPVIDHPLSPVPTPAETKSSPSDEPNHPLSPESTPLPDSPVILPSILSPTPLSAVTAHPLSPALEDDSETTDVALDQTLQTNADELTTLEDMPEDGTRTEDPVEPLAEIPTIKVAKETGEPSSSAEPLEEPSSSSVHAPSSESVSESDAASQEEQSPASSLTMNDSAPEALDAQSNEVPEEQDVPQPVSVVADSAPETTDPVDDATEAPAALPNGHLDTHSKSDDVDIEALQQRLKLVEQRFSGKSSRFIKWALIVTESQ